MEAGGHEARDHGIPGAVIGDRRMDEDDRRAIAIVDDEQSTPGHLDEPLHGTSVAAAAIPTGGVDDRSRDDRPGAR